MRRWEARVYSSFRGRRVRRPFRVSPTSPNLSAARGCVALGEEGCDRGRGRGCPPLAERDVQGATGEWSRGPRPHLRQAAPELHPHPARRHRPRRAQSLRPHPGSHHLQDEMKVSASVKPRCERCKVINLYKKIILTKHLQERILIFLVTDNCYLMCPCCNSKIIS